MLETNKADDRTGIMNSPLLTFSYQITRVIALGRKVANFIFIQDESCFYCFSTLFKANFLSCDRLRLDAFPFNLMYHA